MQTLALASLNTYYLKDAALFRVSLNNLFRLQIVSGKYAEADSGIRSLRDLRTAHNSAGAAARLAPFEIYARAKERQGFAGLPFEEAFRQSFRDFYGQLDDKSADQLFPWFSADLNSLQNDLRKSLDGQKGKDEITLSDALDLIKKYQVLQVFRDILPLMEPLIAEDDARRYIIDDNILVKTPDGASIATVVVRPRSATARLPALLGFSIYANNWVAARTTAAHGYVGVMAYTRGKGRSPDVPVPYEHDGSDACAVIDWIKSGSSVMFIFSPAKPTSAKDVGFVLFIFPLRSLFRLLCLDPGPSCSLCRCDLPPSRSR